MNGKYSRKFTGHSADAALECVPTVRILLENKVPAKKVSLWDVLSAKIRDHVSHSKNQPPFNLLIMPLPKPLSDIKKELELLIAASNPQKALQYLQDLLPEGSGKRSQATLIQSKLSNANQKYLTGQIKFDDEAVEIAQVSAAIIEMANALSELDFELTQARPLAAIPKFVIIYNEQDKLQFEQLKRQLSVLKRFNKIRYYDVYDIEGGDLVKKAKEEIADADYLLVLITPDLFNEKPIDWFEVVSHALGEGRRMIPLRIKNLGFEIPELEKLKSLPSMGKWVSDLPNQDSAYAEIVGELRKLLPK